MENRPVYAYIPPNLSSTGGLLGGMLDTRRVIEGMIGAGIAIMFYLLLRPIVGGAILFYICAGIGLALLVVGLLGVNGEPFSIFLFNIANYEQRRIFVTLRPPMPELNAKKKKQAQEPEEENKLLKLLRKGSVNENKEDGDE
jgi:hypothetical protein